MILRGLRGGKGHTGVAKGFPLNVTCGAVRLLVTAGLCNQCFGAFLRLLPTAGVCDQHEGATIRLLPNAGACDQHVGATIRLLPTAGVC